MENELNSVDALKSKLANVFDDDFDTNQWRNYADILILFLIVVSTIEIFLSTFDSIELLYGDILRFVDNQNVRVLIENIQVHRLRNDLDTVNLLCVPR